MDQQNCPKCHSVHVYKDGNLWACPECSHEWSAVAPRNEDVQTQAQPEAGVRDANGNLLKDGDNVTVIKSLKIKGSTESIKVGTKVRNIRLFDGHDGHNISCRIDGFGAIDLKSEFVKKV